MADEEYPAQVHYLPLLPLSCSNGKLVPIFDDDKLMIDAPVPGGSFDKGGMNMSNADMESMTLANTSRYSTGEDWTMHRSTIARLYIEENKTLKEVMSIMKHSYGFNARQV